MFERQITHNAVSSNGWSNPKLCRDARHIVVVLSTNGLSLGHRATFKVAHSFAETAPDFTSASSSSNPWQYVQTYNLEDGKPIDGSDGIAFITNDDVVMLEINQNLANWVAIQVSDLDAGTASSMIILATS